MYPNKEFGHLLNRDGPPLTPTFTVFEFMDWFSDSFDDLQFWRMRTEGNELRICDRLEGLRDTAVAPWSNR